jgi:hypothetical protein
MGALEWLRSRLRPASLSRSERGRAARLGVYFLEAEGFDRAERSMFRAITGVCLNAEECAGILRAPPRQPHWEDVEYKRWGPRPLLDLVESHALEAPAARLLLARAARGEPHELLPAPLSAEELRRAESSEVHLVWYEDKFHYGIGRDSYAISVCLSREEAEADCRSKGRRPAESGGDGYDIVGPVPLKGQPAEVVREVLRRREAGEPGPVPIPSIYW